MWRTVKAEMPRYIILLLRNFEIEGRIAAGIRPPQVRLDVSMIYILLVS